MPEVPKRDGQGAAEADSESCEKKDAEEGEGVKINREDVVQAALTVERWCAEHMDEFIDCKCPFASDSECRMKRDYPSGWSLETFLRTRGLKND